MPEEAGPQAEPGLLPAETSPEDHQIPAAPQGETGQPGLAGHTLEPHPWHGHPAATLTATVASQPLVHPAAAALAVSELCGL